MKYISVSTFSEKWKLPEGTVRHYCATGRLKGAFMIGEAWNIPGDAALPEKESKKKFNRNPLLNRLKEEKDMRLKGGIYHRTQIA